MTHFTAHPFTIDKLKLVSVRRTLRVQRTEAITPHMLRVVFEGEELNGFRSPSPHDHIKAFFPGSGDELIAREYTPRHFSPDKLQLTIDFFLHGGGAGSNWARAAKLGDSLTIGGPRGSTVIDAPGFWWLLVGDETALPAIARRLEEMSLDTQAHVFAAVTGAEEEYPLPATASIATNWVHRPESKSNDPAPLLERLAAFVPPKGPGFVWIAAEGNVSKAVRNFVIEHWNHPAEWVKASSYWTSAAEDVEGHS